jgi:hypothetical protein
MELHGAYCNTTEPHKVQRVDKTLEAYQLLHDALDLTTLPDRGYGSPANTFELLGLTANTENLHPFLRLLYVDTPVAADLGQEEATRKVRFLKDGMVDATPHTDEIGKITKRNSNESLLLMLPAEIRNKIFGYAIGGHQVFLRSNPGKLQCGPWYQDDDESVYEEDRENEFPDGILSDMFQVMVSRPAASQVTVSHGDRPSGPGKVLRPFVSLHQACRQIYSETALLPFSSNRFWYPNAQALMLFIERLNASQLHAITDLFFCVSEDIQSPTAMGVFGPDRFQHLGELAGLKRVEILVVIQGYPLFDKNNPIPAWTVQDALQRIKTGLEPEIKEKAAKGVEVVFKLTKMGR